MTSLYCRPVAQVLIMSKPFFYPAGGLRHETSGRSPPRTLPSARAEGQPDRPLQDKLVKKGPSRAVSPHEGQEGGSIGPASAAASFGWRNGCASPGEGVDSCRQRSQIGNPGLNRQH